MVFGVALTLRIAGRVGAGMFAGKVADRFGVRRSMIAAAVASGSCTAFFYEVGAIWQIFALVLTLNVIDALFVPIYKSVIPTLVGPRLYPKALAAGTLAYELSNIAGPSLAALLIAAIGFRGNFLLDAASFVLVAAMAASLPRSVERQPEAPGEPRRKRRIRWGLAQMVERPRLRRSLLLQLGASLVGAYVFVATVGYVKTELDLSDSLYAVTMAAFGLGSCGGAILYGNLSGAKRVRAERAIFPGLLGGLALAALTPSWLVLLVAWVIAGFAYALANVRANEILVDASDEPERPHLFAAQFSLSHAGWGLAYPLAGWLETTIGFRGGAVVFLALLGVFVAGVLVARRRGGDPGAGAA